MNGLTSTTTSLTALGHTHLTAMMKSGQIWNQGLAEMSSSMAALLQVRMDRTTALMKALGSAGSLKEAFELQASHAQASLGDAFAETARLTNVSTKLAAETMAPLKEQLTVAVETFTRALPNGEVVKAS